MQSGKAQSQCPINFAGKMTTTSSYSTKNLLGIKPISLESPLAVRMGKPSYKLLTAFQNTDLSKTSKITKQKQIKMERRDSLVRFILSNTIPDLMPQIGYYKLCGPNHHHVIKTTNLTIGSSEDCDITIDFKEVYPEHLRIEYVDSEFVLVVLGRLGLKVNNQFYGFNRRIILESGDRIRVMDWETTFYQ